MCSSDLSGIISLSLSVLIIYYVNISNINFNYFPIILLFGFSFFAINLISQKVFKAKKSVSVVLSFLISGALTYSFFSSGRNFNDFFFYDFSSIPSSLLLIIVPLIIILILAYSFSKFKEDTFLIFGILFLASGIFSVVYKKTFMIVLGIIFILIWWKIRKKSKNFGKNENFPLNEKETPSSEPVERQKKEIEKIKYLRRQRSLYDLKQKYMSYLFSYYTYRNNKHKQERIRQAMNTIIEMAKKQGCKKSKFLSRKIGGRKAKSPEELK